MNEAETRAEHIDPKLKACGWGVVECSKVLREYHITQGKIQKGGGRGKKEIADYVLVYKGIKLAIVEAKSDEQEAGEGVMQAKKYAQKLQLETTYSTNGKAIYQICMKTGEEGLVTDFLSPDELWNKTFAEQNNWREQGVTRQAITKAQIESFRILIPPLKEQQTIVRPLDALRAETQKLEAVYQKKIDDLEELKKSILQKAFSGELRTENYKQCNGRK